MNKSKLSNRFTQLVQIPLVIAIVSVAAGMQTAHAQNLLPDNPGFEYGTTNTANYYSDASQVDANALPGWTFGLNSYPNFGGEQTLDFMRTDVETNGLSYSPANGEGAYFLRIINAYVQTAPTSLAAVTGGNTYDFSWLGGNRTGNTSTENFSYTLSFYDSDSSLLSSTDGIGTLSTRPSFDSNFDVFNISEVAPLGAASAGIRLTNDRSGDWLYFDGASITSATEAVPEPSSYALLVAGGLVLLAIRKRAGQIQS